MSPVAPHEPWALNVSGTSAIGNGEPAARSMRFSCTSAKNGRVRPSGDQNGERPFSVPGTGRASKPVIERIQMRGTLFDPAAPKASCEPSGDSSRNDEGTSRLKLPPSGGGTANRID